MSWAIGMFLRDTSLRFMEAGMDSARATLGAMGSRQAESPVMYSGRGDYGHQNPWSMPDPYGNQNDITWLL
jgi:hypothetical protein